MQVEELSSSKGSWSPGEVPAVEMGSKLLHISALFFIVISFLDISVTIEAPIYTCFKVEMFSMIYTLNFYSGAVNVIVIYWHAG